MELCCADVHEDSYGPQMKKFSGLVCVQVPVGTCRHTSPEGGSFTFSDATLWIMCSPLVEDPRKESEGALGIFDGLWPLLMT